MLIEYMTREKPLLPSSIPFILFSSSYPSTSPFSSTLFDLYFLCFLFWVLSCTSVSSSSDSSHEICSSLESWPSMLANFSNNTTILQISFLKSYNSLKFFNFLKTSVFYFVSVCYFVFLTLDLWTAFALAFVCILLILKGL